MQISITLTDAQRAAIAAGLHGDQPADDRVTSYIQSQVESIAAQHVQREAALAFTKKGLPAAVLSIGLTPEQIALLEVDADKRMAEREARRQ